MPIIFSITFSISIIVLFCLTLIILKFNFKNVLNYDFSFRRNFSFESHNFYNGELTNLYRFFFIFYSIALFTPYIYSFSVSEILRNLNMYIIFSGVMFLLNILCKTLLFFTKTLNMKVFSTTYVIRLFAYISSVLFIIFGLIFTYSQPSPYFLNNEWVITLFLMLFLVIIIPVLAFFFIKKFYQWYKLEHGENGEFIKPKINYLAFCEWITNFSEILFVILLSFLVIYA